MVVEIEIKLNALTDTEQKINALILAMQADNEELARKILTNDLLITSEELKFVHAQIKILSRQSSDNTKLLSQIQDYLQDFLEKSVDTID